MEVFGICDAGRVCVRNKNLDKIKIYIVKSEEM